jgi:hypothetical protein
LSGCLAEMNGTNLLSEPPAITEVMLDATLESQVQLNAVRQLLQAQYLAMPNRPNVIVKWNAWDLLRWDSLRRIWPQVPVVILLRDPAEILASHYRQAGRHMSGDPTMSVVHSVFSRSSAASVLGARDNILVGRVAILRELLRAVAMAATDPQVMLVDYQQLNVQKMQQIARFFQLPEERETVQRMGARMQFHSKIPTKTFQPDSVAKRESLTPQAHRYIAGQLFTPYQSLVQRAGIGD